MHSSTWLPCNVRAFQTCVGGVLLSSATTELSGNTAYKGTIVALHPRPSPPPVEATSCHVLHISEDVPLDAVVRHALPWGPLWETPMCEVHS